MSTILVTGAAGFIGSHVARALLADGHRVVGVDNFDPAYGEARKRANIAGLPEDRFALIEQDIRDPDLLERVRPHAPESVFHFAALAGVRPSLAEPERYESVNVEGLRNVLQVAAACGCAGLVFASSSSVYGNNAKIPFAEEDPAGPPISPYGWTKLKGEELCRTASGQSGLAIAAVRLFTVYGPAQRPDLAIAKFMSLIASDEPLPMFGSGESSRDYTFISDTVQGLLASEGWTRQQRRGAFRVFNLGSDRPISLHALIEEISRVVGRPARIRQLPQQPGDVDRTWADLTRSRSELKYDPRISLSQGLEAQWAWQREVGRTAVVGSRFARDVIVRGLPPLREPAS